MATTYSVEGVPSPVSGQVSAFTAQNLGGALYLVSFDLPTEQIPNESSELGFIFTEYEDGKPVGTGTFGTPAPSSVTVTRQPDGSYRYDYVATFIRHTGSFELPAPSATPPCFVAGTRLSTPDGPVPVERLRPGDLVSLMDGRAVPVRWIGRRRVADATVIRFAPGSLPAGPAHDLLVSDDHGMWIDGALVPAGLLVDGVGILAERRAEAVFLHVELEAHGVLLAEGAPAESYLDTGNRGTFSNCPLGYDPTRSTAEPCAELVLAGARLAALRALLPAPQPA